LRAALIHPTHPGPQAGAIGLDQGEKLLRMTMLHQRQFRLFSNACPKHKNSNPAVVGY
jgi:hypothetical protein